MPGLRRQRHRRARHRRGKNRLHEQDVLAHRPGGHEESPRRVQSPRQSQPRQNAPDRRRLWHGAKTSREASRPVNPRDYLPVKETESPANPDEISACIRHACESGTPLYPIGGGTSLDFGIPAKAEGRGLSLGKLNRVIDYPARDMTVTVEAGITMEALAELLAKERQRLPVAVTRSTNGQIEVGIATSCKGKR